MAKNKKIEISLEEKLGKALIPVEEQPYKIPDNWVWTRLGEIGDYKKGPFGSSLTKSMFVEKGMDTIKVYEQKNAIEKNAKIGNYYITKNYFLEAMTGFEVKPSDIIVSCAGTIGETYILPNNAEKGIINQALMKISLKDSIKKSYYLEYFDYFLKEESKEKSKGTAMKNIPPFKVFKEFPFPLPPLNEQRRIVEKLDFLFDKIKKAKELIEEIKNDIENRKISILDRTFKGILTSKWRSKNRTFDVKELLKSINDEKIKKWEEDCIQAEKEGSKKPKKPIIREVEDMIVPVEEQPYKLPDNWVWVRLGDIIDNIKYGFNASGQENGDVKLLRITDIQNDDVNWDNVPYCKISEEEYETYQLKVRDILIARTGGTIGKTFLIRKIPKNLKSVYASYLIKFYPNKNISEIYLKNYFNTDFYWKLLKMKSRGTGQPNVNSPSLQALLIPLPPLEEQQEIVRILDEVLENENKVKELLELEERIDILEKSILNKAFRGELGTQNSSDKPAIELLKEIL